MTTGGKLLLLSGCLAATGCVADQTVQVRPISDPNSKLHYSGGLLAEARGQLAIGAVGLALESFRTLQRQQPESADVYAGIAACYAAMGRLDLTRTNYELALAYAPSDPSLLQALAITLDRLGETEQAAQVRTEVRTVAARAAQPLPEARVTPLGVPRATAMTVKLPAASPAPAASVAPEPHIAPAQLADARLDLATSRLVRMSEPAVVAAAEVAVDDSALAPAAIALVREPATSEITSLVLPAANVDLHVARANQVPQRGMVISMALAAAEEPKIAAQLASKASDERSLAPPAARVAKLEAEDGAVHQGPYLTRTSLREVALITVSHAAREEKLQSRGPQLPQMALLAAPPADRPPSQPAPRQLLATASVRWAPLPYASRGQPIQLLNAARTDGLAARTRVALADRGWRKITIGNARVARRHSLVLYSAGRWHVAARLAARFGCKAVRVAAVKNVVVLLGRDAILKHGAITRA